MQVQIEGIENLIKKWKRKIAAIIVFGSAVRKENPRDIDLLVILEDDVTMLDRMRILDAFREFAEEFERKTGIVLHVQPDLRTISETWIMILKAEPWILTAIDQGIPIFQKDEIVDRMKEVVRNIHFLYEERAERLIERARKSLIDVQRTKIEMFERIAEAAIDAAQLLLFTHKKIIFERKRVVEELKRGFSEELGEALEDFIDIAILYEKILEGQIKDLKLEEIEHYLRKAKNFIKKVQEIIGEKTR